MSNNHIPTEVFEEISWETVDDFILIENYTCGSVENYKQVVEKISGVWDRLSCHSETEQIRDIFFPMRLLEACAECESFEPVLSKTDFTPCWIINHILGVIEKLIEPVISNGLCSKEATGEVMFTPPDFDNYYSLELPLWLSEAIKVSVSDEDMISITEKVRKVSSFYTGNKTREVTFSECAVCCVLKPDHK